MPRRKDKSQKVLKSSLELLINMIMKDGKKEKAKQIVYTALGKVRELKSLDFNNLSEADLERVDEVLTQMIENAGPELEVKSKRIGGANYQIPVSVNGRRRVTLAFRHMIRFARARVGAMGDRLSAEMQDILDNRGASVKMKENILKMAAANRSNVRR